MITRPRKRTKTMLAAAAASVALLASSLALGAVPPAATATGGTNPGSAPAPSAPAPASTVPVPATPVAVSTPEIKTYCANIALAASDARVAWQTEKLNDLEGRIKTRIAELEAKTAELRQALEKREQLQREANEKLVGIYAKMKPETAATQIASLDDDLAAIVLGQLNARQASAIFNEIVPEKAAKLAAMIASTGANEKKP